VELNLRSDGRTAAPAAARNAPGPAIEFLFLSAPSVRIAQPHLGFLTQPLVSSLSVNDEVVAKPARSAIHDRAWEPITGEYRDGAASAMQAPDRDRSKKPFHLNRRKCVKRDQIVHA